MIYDLNIADLPSLPFSERSNLPTVRAVYIVCDAQGNVLYVGATCSLRSRLKSHHRRQQFEAIGHVSIAWIEVTQPLILRKTEAVLIEQLQPSLNRNRIPLAGQLVPVCALVSLATKRALKTLADKDCRTVSQTLKRLIERSLKAD